MDANQQRFWLLADADDWPGIDAHAQAEFDRSCRRLRLRDVGRDRTPAGSIDPTAAAAAEGIPSTARDRFGSFAYWDAGLGAVLAHGALGPDARPVVLFRAPAGESVSDLALGFDDVLYIATAQAGTVRLLDRRGRWKEALPVSLDGFFPHRLAADPAGGAWALDKTHRAIARLRGLPMRDGQPGPFLPTVFRPIPENPDPPRLSLDPRQPAWADPAEQPVSIACSPGGRLALLTQQSDQAWVRLRDGAGRWTAAKRLAGVGRCQSITWLSESRMAVLPAAREDNAGRPLRQREIPAYDPDDQTPELLPAGGVHPLIDPAPGPFVQGVTLPPHYPVGMARSRPVVALSAEHFAAEGLVPGRVLDAGREGAVWHRLYLEALMPPQCGVVLSLFATDDPERRPKAGDEGWHEHHFGATPAWSLADRPEYKGGPAAWFAPPRGVWMPDRSEIPHHAGLLGADPVADRAGLFMALIQRPGRRVRALKGRYLHLLIRLLGPGHRTPQVAAVRAYASRFSYRDQYLPELYREELFGADADQRGRATPADFLERFLDIFESFLTPLEDRVAYAHLLTDPRSAPDEALDWLGAWMGVAFDPSFPPRRRREWIASASRLYEARGTLAAMQLALEIATGGRWVRESSDGGPGSGGGREAEFPTGGGVTGGRILVIEEFRLRRTLSTILGANLSLEEDPLLPGLLFSANSYVGETLILGDEETKEFLALFRGAFSAGPAVRQAEESAVSGLYSRLAHRVAVLVQDTVDAAELGLVRRVARREAPAHVVVEVVQASRKLIVGLASLVGADTYLGAPAPEGVAELDASRLGDKDFLRGLPALDPRLGSGEDAAEADPPPRAAIQGPKQALAGETITLSGARSAPAPGRVLNQFLWRLVPPAS